MTSASVRQRRGTRKRSRSLSRQAGRARLVPHNGPCAKSKSTVELGLVTVFDSPVLHLEDQADAAKAAVTAFNKRGGVGGRCL